MKETEEHLKSLTKENFNLKLRIFFLEMKTVVSSKMNHTNNSTDYVELLMENDSLKNDLDEMRDLIKQAAMAIDILEQNQNLKNMENDNEKKIKSTIIENQKRTIVSLIILINSLNNVRNTQINRDNIVPKIKSELNISKNYNVNFLDQTTSFMEDEIKNEGLKELLLKNKVRDQQNKNLILALFDQITVNRNLPVMVYCQKNQILD